MKDEKKETGLIHPSSFILCKDDSTADLIVRRTTEKASKLKDEG